MSSGARALTQCGKKRVQYAWRTDIYVNVRTHESLFVFATSSGVHPVSCLDGGQARVAWPDNESSSLCPREPGL